MPSPSKPSQELLRSMTDEQILRALMQDRRLLRVELAAITGLSKPTVSESVRRLAELGLVADTGERTSGRGRGRVGSYYALTDDIGAALVLSIAPDGVIAERVDIYGEVVARAENHVDRPTRAAQVAAAVEEAAVRARGSHDVRIAVVSVADPVDRETGRLVQLPSAPFLVGDLSPVEILSPHVTGAVVVDNDVNWAAQAEKRTGGAQKLDNFVYLHLGEGLGCAVVSDGEVRRGHQGIAGEIAHLLTVGSTGRAVPFIEVFAELGLRQNGSTAIDVDRLLDAATHGVTTTRALGAAISGVLAALIAVVDPEVIVIGGSWGAEPVVLRAIATAFSNLPRHVPVRAARLTAEPSLTGARRHALDSLRARIAGLPHALRTAAVNEMAS